jgi:hypothetical protein
MMFSRLAAVFLIAGVCAGLTSAQEPGAPASPPPSSSTTTPAVPAAPALTAEPAPGPQDPRILDDGGFSIEPFYWLSSRQPLLLGGKEATEYTNLAYFGRSKKPYGVEIGIPAGRANTLRITYFRVQGNTNGTAGQDESIFGEAYPAGTYLAANYILQSGKISWDYLSYTFKNKIRFKTLYEVQYVNIGTNTNAPYLPETEDSSGNVNTNSSTGSKNLIYPTFGAEFEQQWKKGIRWEAKASGFGFPHHSDIWDAQVDVALRMKAVELFLGGKAYHFKTGESGSEYFIDTLQGAFVGVRYYWRQGQN